MTFTLPVLHFIQIPPEAERPKRKKDSICTLKKGDKIVITQSTTAIS